MKQEFNRLLFNIDMPQKPLALGAMLVAEPFMRDEHFCHSVICIVDYQPGQSSMGVVLNHPTPFTLDQLLENVVRENIQVFNGGPMSPDRLYFIHTLGDIIPDARQIDDDLWIGGDFDIMTEYVNSGYPIEGKIRFFVGYSGWGPHQLEDEISNHVWAVVNHTLPLVMLSGSGDSYWHTTVRHLGPTFRGWSFHPQNVHSN